MKKQNWWGVLLVSPYVLSLSVLFIFPVFFSLYITFTKWDLFNSPKWVGLKNWVSLLKEESFWMALRNVGFFALIFVPLQTIIALVIAFFLNREIYLKRSFRVVYFLPVITPWVAGALIWRWLYNPEYGIINWVLSFFNIEKINWLDNDKWWVVIGAIAIANVWKGIGQSMILFLAGIQNVSKEVVEAAHIDGATGFKMFKKIIMPIVSPITFMVMILSTIAALNAFDIFLVLLGNGDFANVPDRNNVINIMIYKDAFINNKMGSASTAAWALFVIILTITVIQKKMEKRWVHYE